MTVSSDMRTIPRNHTRKIQSIKDRVTTCKMFSLGNNFAGTVCDPSVAWAELYTYDFARLVEHDNKWSVDVHSNLWYELRS